MNQTLFQEYMPDENPELIIAYNNAFNESIAKHLSSKDDTVNATGSEIAEMTDDEFVDYLQSGTKQPITPYAAMCKIVGLPEYAPTIDLIQMIQLEYDLLMDQYESNGVDGRRALLVANNIIGHTEAYITGYSRDIGRLVGMLTRIDPKLNGPKRWHDKIWVPEEDGHDRLWRLFMLGCGADDITTFDRDHISHLQVGTHLPVESILSTQLYVTSQEGNTVPSYGNDASLLGPVLSEAPKLIRVQESRHTRSYSDVTGGVLDVDPDTFVINQVKEFDGFEMPGKKGIPDFDTKSVEAAITGILDPVSILVVQRALINRLSIEHLEFKSEEAKAAQARLVDPSGPYGIEMLEKRQRQLEKVRARAIDKARKSGGLLPAIIGVTVVHDPKTYELSFPMAA